MINYYILSSSILIDIDVLSGFFVFIFVYFILRKYQTRRNYFLFLAGLSMFFGLANRYPMMILVYLGIGGYYYLNKELKNDFKNYVMMGILSTTFFVITWSIYSIFIEPGNFFSFISHNVDLGSEQFLSLTVYFGSFVLNISQFIRLFTFPATILMVWSFFHFFSKKSKLIKVLMIYVLSILLFFLIIPRPAFGYPRYFMTIFPGVSILIGIFLYKNLESLNLNKNKIIAIILSFSISLVFLLILSPQATIYASNGLIKATNLPDFVFNLLASLPLFFVFLFKKEDRRHIVILILIALILSYSVYFDIKLLNHESNIKETGEYIKEKTRENEIIIAPKVFGYYAERRFYINDNNKPELDFSFNHLSKYIKKSWQNPKMDDEFFWPKGFYSGLYSPTPDESELIKASYAILYHPVKDYEPEKRIGDFYIYKLDNM